MPKTKETEIRNMVRRLDRSVLESILLQKNRVNNTQAVSSCQLDDFEDGYNEAGDMYRVINALTVKERLTVIPLVCKLWSDLIESPIYWLYLDFYGFICQGGWLQRRLKLAQLATGFISILSDYGDCVLSIDIGNEHLQFHNQLSVCKDNAFLKAVLRLCPNIVSLRIAGKAVTSTVLETAAHRQRLKRLHISETARGKSAPTEGFLKLLQRCPELEELSFPAWLMRSSMLNSKNLQWIRTSLREARGSYMSQTLITRLEINCENNHFSGIMYDAFKLLGEWFPELTEFITPNLAVNETMKPAHGFHRLKTLSINAVTVLWTQGESKRDTQNRAVNCFTQIFHSCPILEKLRFSYSSISDYPNILNALNNGPNTIKEITLQFAGLEIDENNFLLTSENGIAPRLKILQLNFCKVSLPNAKIIAKMLCPKLSVSSESNCQTHRFELLQKE